MKKNQNSDRLIDTQIQKKNKKVIFFAVILHYYKKV